MVYKFFVYKIIVYTILVCTLYSVWAWVCVLYHNKCQPVRGTSFQVAIKKVFTSYWVRCRWQRVVGIIYATNLVDRINSTPQVNLKLSSGLLYSIVGQAVRWNDPFPSNLETFYELLYSYTYTLYTLAEVKVVEALRSMSYYAHQLFSFAFPVPLESITYIPQWYGDLNSWY